jgi:hypothetical protein
VLHQFLVSTGERFRLRVYILGQGFGLAARYPGEVDRAHRREPTPDEQEWEQVARIQDDLHTLSAESLRSFRALLTSLTAERKDEVLELIQPLGRAGEAPPGAPPRLQASGNRAARTARAATLSRPTAIRRLGPAAWGGPTPPTSLRCGSSSACMGRLSRCALETPLP